MTSAFTWFQSALFAAPPVPSHSLTVTPVASAMRRLSQTAKAQPSMIERSISARVVAYERPKKTPRAALLQSGVRSPAM